MCIERVRGGRYGLDTVYRNRVLCNRGVVVLGIGGWIFGREVEVRI
jgi:hypothetical protein